MIYFYTALIYKIYIYIFLCKEKQSPCFGHFSQQQQWSEFINPEVHFFPQGVEKHRIILFISRFTVTPGECKLFAVPATFAKPIHSNWNFLRVLYRIPKCRYFPRFVRKIHRLLRSGIFSRTAKEIWKLSSAWPAYRDRRKWSAVLLIVIQVWEYVLYRQYFGL